MRPCTKFWPRPFAFVEPRNDSEWPRVVDAQGNTVVHLFWPGHRPEETEEAERATYEVGRAMADLLNMWDSVLPDRTKMT